MVFFTRRLLLLIMIAIPVPALPGAEEAASKGYAHRVQLIVLVRHAEKASDQGADPGLTAAGEARALALQAALTHSSVGAIITTEWKRTQATAAPLAAALGMKPIVVGTAVSDSTEAHVLEVANTVRAQSAEVVLVVGHSNTVPEIIAALGGPKVRPLGEDDYGNLFLLWRGQGQARLLQARY